MLLIGRISAEDQAAGQAGQFELVRYGLQGVHAVLMIVPTVHIGKPERTEVAFVRVVLTHVTAQLLLRENILALRADSILFAALPAIF